MEKWRNGENYNRSNPAHIKRLTKDLFYNFFSRYSVHCSSLKLYIWSKQCSPPLQQFTNEIWQILQCDKYFDWNPGGELKLCDLNHIYIWNSNTLIFLRNSSLAFNRKIPRSEMDRVLFFRWWKVAQFSTRICNTIYFKDQPH